MSAGVRSRVARALREQEPWGIHTDYERMVADMCDAVAGTDRGSVDPGAWTLQRDLAALIDPVADVTRQDDWRGPMTYVYDEGTERALRGGLEGCPAHYQGDGEVTCDRAIRSQMAGVEIPPEAAWWWGCAVKYLWRWPWKGGQEDLDKARDCVGRLSEALRRP